MAKLESLFGVTSRKDFVTSILKRFSDPGADAVLIFDEKHGFSPGEGRDLFGCARAPALRCDGCGTREVEIEPAAFTRAAGYANVSAGLSHDSVYGSETGITEYPIRTL